MCDVQVELFRRFNRFYTQTIGVLTDRYLGQARPLAEARLLFEIGSGTAVRDLRARLGWDAGYLSRLLRSLHDQGLVEVRREPRDRRVRVAEPTRAGSREWADLDERSASAVRQLLDPLTADERAELLSAVETVRRRLRLAAITVGVVDPESSIARKCLEEYAAELAGRFPGGFDRRVLVAPAQARGRLGAFLVATERNAPAGCGAVRTMATGVAEIRHLWVAAGARRLGLGRRLLRELERLAADRGLRLVRLDTHQALTEAIAMYRSSGYREVDRYNENPYAHHWFEKQLLSVGPPACGEAVQPLA